MMIAFYILLFCTVISLWMPAVKHLPVWPAALILTIILGIASAQMDIIALVPLAVLASALILYENSTTPWLSVISGLASLIVSAGLLTHYFPGFHNLKIIDNVTYTPDAISFSQYLNIDKTIAGIFILGLTLLLIKRKNEWQLLGKQLLLYTPIVILVVLAMTYLLGFARFEFKVPADIFIWAITNLLLVCMAEEAFFRGLIQKNLAVLLKKNRRGNVLAILIVAILFGAAHYPGGMKYVLIASVAGLGFGWIYAATKRIEGAILAHFTLNLTHFIFFTYPALAASFK